TDLTFGTTREAGSAPLPCVAFGQVGEAVEVGFPHRSQDRFQGPGPPAVRSIEPCRAAVAARHEARVLEHSKVLGDGGPTDVEVGRDLPRGQLAIPHQSQDLATTGARYGPEGGVIHVAHSTRST